MTYRLSPDDENNIAELRKLLDCNIEAPTWVMEEIKKLKAKLDKIDSRCTDLLSDIKMIHEAQGKT